MNRTEMLNEARRLLETYYAGDAGPDEAGHLRGLLESLRPLPSDLEEELALLHLLDNARAEAEEAAEIPEGLETALRMQLHRQAVAERRPRRRPIWWVAAAAVAAIGLTAVLHQTEPVTLAPDRTMASADTTEQILAPKRSAETPSVSAQTMAAATPQTATKGSAAETPVGPRVVEASSLRATATPSSSAPSEPSSPQTKGSPEAIALAFSDLHRTSTEVLSAGREDLESVTTEMTVNMADVRTQLMDGAYPDMPDGDCIIEP